MFYNILDKKRLDILPLFKEFKKDFYLGGGTALALQLGHRDSADFDFFTEKNINTKELFEKIKEIFKGYKILKAQEEKNTLTVFIDNSIKISFFTYKYELLNKLVSEENFRLASVFDIACMKLSAITGRASSKDYIDIYFILKRFSLKYLLRGAKRKLKDIDESLILKSLVYFDDVEKEPIKFKNNNKISFLATQDFLKKTVKAL